MKKYAPRGFIPGTSVRKHATQAVAAAIGMIGIAVACGSIIIAMTGNANSPLVTAIGDWVGWGVLFATPLGFALLIALAAKEMKRVRQFWNEVALSYGWTYAPAVSLKGESAVMFRQGHSRAGRHLLSGQLHRMPFRTFQYSFTVGQGKHSTVYHFSVYEFVCAGTFPHIYLNYLGNYNPSTRSGFGGFPRVPLPLEFEKKFQVYAPDQYEIEALEMFTPDLLAFLLDEKWRYDFELLDQKLLVFGKPAEARASSFMDELETIARLVEQLSSKLTSARFAPIGTKPHRL